MADTFTAATIVVQSAFLSAGPALHGGAPADRAGGRARGIARDRRQARRRLIVDHPHATPPPFMGPVIDNQAADQLQESFLDLLIKGGRPIKQLSRPDESRPFLTPAIIDVTGVEKRSDAELFGPVLQVSASLISTPRSPRPTTRATASPPRCRRQPAALRPLLGELRARRDQLEQADQRRAVQRSVRRRRAQRQSPPSAYYAADYCAYPVTSSERNRRGRHRRRPARSLRGEQLEGYAPPRGFHPAPAHTLRRYSR
jgi:succinylglutamic semialdehyde dehydrogenase